MLKAGIFLGALGISGMAMADGIYCDSNTLDDGGSRIELTLDGSGNQYSLQLRDTILDDNGQPDVQNETLASDLTCTLGGTLADCSNDEVAVLFGRVHYDELDENGNEVTYSYQEITVTDLVDQNAEPTVFSLPLDASTSCTTI